MDGLPKREQYTRRGKRAVHMLVVVLAAWVATVACAPRAAIAADDDSTSAKIPRFYGAKPGSLLKARQRLAAGDKSLQRAVKNLVATADEALEIPPPSVTEKEQAPPSGDRHDYMSLAPYFWPDPTKPGGTPLKPCRWPTFSRATKNMRRTPRRWLASGSSLPPRG